MIVRRLLGLEDTISLGQPGPTHDARSWTFDLDPDGVDPVLGIERIQGAYLRRFPDYLRGITDGPASTGPERRIFTRNTSAPKLTASTSASSPRSTMASIVAALHHLGQVRCRLPRAFQVQPAETDRTAGPIGLHAGPVPDSRIRQRQSPGTSAP